MYHRFSISQEPLVHIFLASTKKPALAGSGFGLRRGGRLLAEPPGVAMLFTPVALPVLVHRPVIAELAEVVGLGKGRDGEALALGLAEGAVPGLLVKALTGSGGDPTHWGLSAASAHGVFPAAGAHQEAARHAKHSRSGYREEQETKSPARWRGFESIWRGFPHVSSRLEHEQCAIHLVQLLSDSIQLCIRILLAICQCRQLLCRCSLNLGHLRS